MLVNTAAQTQSLDVKGYWQDHSECSIIRSVKSTGKQQSKPGALSGHPLTHRTEDYDHCKPFSTAANKDKDSVLQAHRTLLEQTTLDFFFSCAQRLALVKNSISGATCCSQQANRQLNLDPCSCCSVVAWLPSHHELGSIRYCLSCFDSLSEAIMTWGGLAAVAGGSTCTAPHLQLTCHEQAVPLAACMVMVSWG